MPVAAMHCTIQAAHTRPHIFDYTITRDRCGFVNAVRVHHTAVHAHKH